ncbi:MAG: phage tail protein [Phycisphaerae bacterium]
MLAIQVKVDERSLKEAAHILRAIPRAMPRVFRRAINRTVDMAATDLKRRIGEQVTAKKSEIAKGIGKKKATYTDLTGSIGATSFRPGLLAFPGTKQTRHGVTYRISRMAGRKTIKHGFIGTMPSGHRGVFVRGGPSRLPITELRGPSIWRVITDTAGLLKACVDAAGDRMGKLINDQIGVEFRRWQNR